jgi:hypothetical protein
MSKLRDVLLPTEFDDREGARPKIGVYSTTSAAYSSKLYCAALGFVPLIITYLWWVYVPNLIKNNDNNEINNVELDALCSYTKKAGQVCSGSMGTSNPITNRKTFTDRDAALAQGKEYCNADPTCKGVAQSPRWSGGRMVQYCMKNTMQLKPNADWVVWQKGECAKSTCADTTETWEYEDEKAGVTHTIQGCPWAFMQDPRRMEYACEHYAPVTEHCPFSCGVCKGDKAQYVQMGANVDTCMPGTHRMTKAACTKAAATLTPHFPELGGSYGGFSMPSGCFHFESKTGPKLYFDNTPYAQNEAWLDSAPDYIGGYPGGHFEDIHKINPKYRLLCQAGTEPSPPTQAPVSKLCEEISKVDSDVCLTFALGSEGEHCAAQAHYCAHPIKGPLFTKCCPVTCGTCHEYACISGKGGRRNEHPKTFTKTLAECKALFNPKSFNYDIRTGQCQETDLWETEGGCAHLEAGDGNLPVVEGHPGACWQMKDSGPDRFVRDDQWRTCYIYQRCDKEDRTCCDVGMDVHVRHLHTVKEPKCPTDMIGMGGDNTCFNFLYLGAKERYMQTRHPSKFALGYRFTGMADVCPNSCKSCGWLRKNEQLPPAAPPTPPPPPPH